LFCKLKSLEDIPQGQLAGKICTVIDIVTCLPVEVWFHTNPKASETNFEADLLNLLRAKTLLLLDRGFYQSQSWGCCSGCKSLYIPTQCAGKSRTNRMGRFGVNDDEVS
jgi:hypothetical protein